MYIDQDSWTRRVVWKNLSPLTAALSCGTVALLIYLAVGCWLLPPHALWSPDEGAKLLQIDHLRIEGGQMAYDIPYRGSQLDPELAFAHWELLSIRDGQLYLGRLPLFPLLTLPMVAWFGMYGLYIVPAFGGALLGFLTLRLVPPDVPWFLAWLLVAFGSPVFIYAVLFWEHTLATTLILAGSLLVVRLAPIARWADTRSLARWSAAALIFAGGVYLRQETILFVGALLAATWLLTPTKRWSVAWVGGLTGVLLLPYVPLHQFLFAGQALPDNASHIFVPFAYIRGAGLQAIPDLFVGPSTHEAINSGVLGQIWGAAAVVAIACGSFPRSKRRDTILVAALVVNAVSAAFFLFTPAPYRSGHGLLFTTPWAILALCRTREIWQSRSYYLRLLLLTSLMGLAAYAVAILVVRGSSPHGGMEWGARFAMSFYPVLAFLALWNWRAWRANSTMLATILVLIGLGWGFQARGLWTIWHDKQTNAHLNAAIATLPETHIVSDLRWLPLNAAPIYDQKAWFVAETSAAVDTWLARAADEDLASFGIVTLHHTPLETRLASRLAQYEYRPVSIISLGPLRIVQVATIERAAAQPACSGCLPTTAGSALPLATDQARLTCCDPK